MQTRYTILFSTIAILLGAVFLRSMFFYTDGHLAPPLDDTFIFFQYAKQICQGAAFQYNTGDSPTTGATSLLYPFILSLGFLAGLGKTGILAYSLGLGLVSLIVSSLLIFNIGRRLFNETTGIILGLLFLFNGQILWSFFCGMETGFFMCIILAVLYAFLLEAEKKKYLWTIVFASIMALTRPEGLILSGVLFGFIFFLRKERNYYFLIPVGFGMIFVIMNYAFTGSLTFNTMVAKSPLSRPNGNMLDIAATAGKYFFYVMKDIFFGCEGKYIPAMYANEEQESIYFAPFSLFFAVIGVLYFITKEIREKALGIGTLTICLLMTGFCSLCVSLPVKWHWHRYLIPFYPLFLIFMVSGLSLFVRLICQPLDEKEGKGEKKTRVGFVFIASFFLLFGILNTLYFSVAYGKNCKDIYNQQMALGEWIGKNIPSDAVVAVNDLGAVKYLGDRYVIDLLGLGTNKAGWAWVNGAGSIFEFLESLDQKKYPDYFIIYPSWFSFDKIGMLKEEICQFKLIDSTIAGSPSPMTVYKVDWSLARKGDKVYAVNNELEGYRLVDYVDVGDIENEKAHHYKFWETQAGMFYGLIYQDEACMYPYQNNPSAVVVDAGRQITGGESMVVRTIPGKGLKMVKRTSTYTPIEVWVNGEFLNVWTHENADNAWTEAVYEIPGNKITSRQTRISLPLHRELKHYYVCFSAYYWFYQKA